MNFMTRRKKQVFIEGFHFYKCYEPPQYNWNIVESGIKHHKPTYRCYV